MSEMTETEQDLNECVEFLDVDRVWRTVGVFGKYQVLQIFILSLYALTSCHVVSHYFLGFEPPHQCILPNSSTRLSHYGVSESDSVMSAEKCSINVYHNDNGTTEPYAVLPCVFGNNFSYPKDTSLVSEFDLVCDELEVGQLPETAVMTGLMLGSMLSFTADVYGRKKIQLISQMVVFCTVVPVAFVSNIWMFCAMRFVTGIFIQLVQLSAVVPYIELVPTDSRPALCALLDVGRSASLLVLGLVAYFLQVYSWRVLALITSLTTLPVILNFLFMDESLRWLLVKQKYKDTVQLLIKICKKNNVPLQNILTADTRFIDLVDSKRETANETAYLIPPEKVGKIPPAKMETLLAEIKVLKQHKQSQSPEKRELDHNKNVQPPKTSYLKDLKTIFKARRFLFQFFVAWCMWFVDFFTLFSLYLLPNTLSSDRFVNFILNAGSACVGAPIAWVVMMRVSRRRCSVIFHGLSGIGILVSTLIRFMGGTSPALAAVALSFGLLGRISVSFCLSFIKVYTPEIIPTNLRNTGVGVAYVAGRLGGIAASFSVLLSTYYDWLPGVVLTSCCLVVTCAVFFLPETRDKELPQDIEDIKAWNNEKY